MPDRINTPFTGEHFAAWCRKMVGQPYWYGTCVYKATESLLTRKAAQYPSHYTAARMAKYRQHITEKAVVSDCIGGCKGYAWSNGGQGVPEAIGTEKSISSVYASHGCPDKGANGMFTWAKSKGMDWGAIDTLPEIPGLALFKDGHAGYYIGNGEAVEWQGFSAGCVITQVKKRPWTHWYKLPFIDYGDTDKAQQGKDETLPEPEHPVSGQTALRVTIHSPGGKVNIRTGNGTGYSRITAVAPGTVLEYVATAFNGWQAVKIGSQVGWVSGNYSEITTE